MAKADLRLVQRWVVANPGSGLTEADVPGSTVRERNALSSLGRVAGTLLREFEPSTSERSQLVKFCDGNVRVADWFEGAGSTDAPDAVQDAARRLLLDDGEDGLARLYAALVSPARRRRLGTFFTPKHEVERMISSWSHQNLPPNSVVDVGAGVGIYTVASAQAWPSSEVFAVDVNPVTLGLLALRVASLSEDVRVTMVLDDYAAWSTTTWEELPPPRLVLGNPPYTRMQLLPEQVRDDLVAKAGGLLGRRASLATLLTVISLRLLGPQDGVCLLLPAQWLESDYADGMRGWLWGAIDRRVELRLFSSALFKDAEVDAVSLLVGPVQPSAQEMSVTVDGSGVETRISRQAPCPPRWRGLFERATQSPDHVTGGASPSVATGLQARQKTSQSTLPGLGADVEGELLGDVATVQRGIATGSNSFFVLTDSQRKAWKLPKSALVPVVRRLRTGEGVRQNEWLHDPDGSSADRDRTVGEMAWLLVTGPKPTSSNVLRYLGHGQGLEVDHSVLANQRPDWWDLTPLIRTIDVALSPMSKGVFRMLEVPQNAAILNNLYGLRWNQDVSAARRSAIVQFMQSPKGQEQIRLLARSQASGLLKIEPRALAHLRLPIVD